MLFGDFAKANTSHDKGGSGSAHVMIGRFNHGAIGVF